jgi:hypothetical protein
MLLPKPRTHPPGRTTAKNSKGAALVMGVTSPARQMAGGRGSAAGTPSHRAGTPGSKEPPSDTATVARSKEWSA